MTSPEDLEKTFIEGKIIQMYVLEKIGGPTIGKEFGISTTEVYRILERNNIDRRQRKSLVAQEIMKVYRGRRSIAKLSEHFGLQEKTIEIIISQYKKDN